METKKSDGLHRIPIEILRHPLEIHENHKNLRNATASIDPSLTSHGIPLKF